MRTAGHLLPVASDYLGAKADGFVKGVPVFKEEYKRWYSESHALTIGKKNPTISDFNETLKAGLLLKFKDRAYRPKDRANVAPKSISRRLDRCKLPTALIRRVMFGADRTVAPAIERRTRECLRAEK